MHICAYSLLAVVCHLIPGSAISLHFLLAVKRHHACMPAGGVNSSAEMANSPRLSSYRVVESNSLSKIQGPFQQSLIALQACPLRTSSLLFFFPRLSSLSSLGDSAPERKSPSHHRQPSDTSETTGNFLGQSHMGTGIWIAKCKIT